jgi:uncharacterized membrane protein
VVDLLRAGERVRRVAGHRPGRGRLTGPVALSLLAALVLLAVGALLKQQCVDPHHPAFLSDTCASDFRILFATRHIAAHRLPYVHGGYRVLPGGRVAFTGAEIEYPVLTGLFLWVIGLPVSSAAGFLDLAMLCLAPFAVVSVLLLARMAGRRALFFAAAPGLVWYGFMNVDFLSVAAAVAGIWAWRRGRTGWAAAAFAAGGCVKVWPALFLLPLLADVAFRREWPVARRVVGIAVAVAAAVNLPFLLVNARGWWAPFAFQDARPASDFTMNSVWSWAASGMPTGALDAVTDALTVIVCAGVLVAAHRRAVRSGEYPFLPACAAMLAGVLLVGKVCSPQYLLWLLPFFALLRVPARWWVALVTADTLLYLGFFTWGGATGSHPLAAQAATVGFWGRALLLAALVVVFFRAQPALGAVSASNRRQPLAVPFP